MRHLLALLVPAVLFSGCATQKDIARYVAMDCSQLRSMVEAQNMEARLSNTSITTGRGPAETRAESGSPWAGGRAKSGTGDAKAQEERDAIRAAYRQKGCR